MATQTIATASTTINAPADKVWDALVNPAKIKQYMFGTTVTSDFKEGSPITWKGEFKGKAYEDKGEIRHVERPRLLEYTHYSPTSGQTDTPENYHTVTIELAPAGSATRVTLSQDNNPTEDARKHSEENWNQMLTGLKKLVEAR